MPEFRFTPSIVLPPYGYVPGHELPHPVNDPAGYLYASSKEQIILEPATSLGFLASDPRWLYALDFFNAGFYWEAHEAWEAFWHALGRTSPVARFVQGLIHLAAAAVKIREGKPAGVVSHTQRARELLGDLKAGSLGGTLGLDPESIWSVSPNSRAILRHAGIPHERRLCGCWWRNCGHLASELWAGAERVWAAGA